MIANFVFNFFQVNTYLIYSDTGDTIIIDPGFQDQEETNRLFSFIKNNNLDIKRLLVTHAHLDHILGSHLIFKKYGIRPEIHIKEKDNLSNLCQIAKLMGIEAESPPEPTNFLTEGDHIYWSGPTIKIIETPGHSPGSISFYLNEIECLFCGDLIFENSIGRTDLPGGDSHLLIQSIQKIMENLPDNTILYPGHGPKTTLKNEIKNNPYLQNL